MPNLLICDDEQPLLDELAEWFSATGWNVQTAKSVETVRRHVLANGHPDVLLIERRLPDEDGGDLLAALVRAKPDERPCILAMMGSEAFAGSHQSLPPSDMWLPKPFSPSEANTQFLRAMQASPICAMRRKQQPALATGTSKPFAA